MQKIVINVKIGGFSLSREAILKLRELGHKGALDENIDIEGGLGMNLFCLNIDRDDPLLVRVVEMLGKKANSDYAFLKIVEIPDNIDWAIVQHEDGIEHIAENHRTWS